MKIPTKICQSCGNVFYRKPKGNSFNFKKQKYCSTHCSRKETLSLGWGWSKGKKLTEVHKLLISKSLIGHPANKTSFKKGQTSLRKGMKFPEFSGENHPLWKPKVLHKCPICLKEIELSPWQSKRKFCSLRCRGLGKRGANNPRFKGENSLTKLRSRIRQMAEYTEWRLECFRRDNFTCQNCKNPDSKPREVHHINPYAKIKEKYGFTSPEEARKCEELWNIGNGITLCRTCHRMTDTYPKNLLKK